MPYFYSHFFAFVLRSVNLAYWTWCDWLLFKFFKYFVYIFAVCLSKILFGCFKWMHWCILSEILKFMCHFRSDYISAMAQILKSLDKDNSSPFDCFYENIPPIAFSTFEEKQRNEHNRRSEDDQQMKKSYNVYDRSP